MKIIVQMHDGQEHTFQQADRVKEEKYSVYIYGEGGRVLAILNKGEITQLLTNEETQTQ